MPMHDYYHANNTDYTDALDTDIEDVLHLYAWGIDSFPTVHCAKHGMQQMWDDECIRCYDEWMENLWKPESPPQVEE